MAQSVYSGLEDNHQSRRVASGFWPSGEHSNDAWAALTTRTTLSLAAGLIAEPGFPTRKQLPPVAPVHSLSAGHQVLLDYTLMAQIVWGTALRLQAMRKSWASSRLLGTLAGFLGAATACFLALAADSPVPATLCALLVLGLVLGIRARGTTKLDDKARSFRLEVLSKLRVGLVPDGIPVPSLQTGHRQISWGNGVLGRGHSPVLLASPLGQFPGFGRSKARMTLVCRPLEENRVSTEQLANEVGKRVLENARYTQAGPVACGPLVVIDSDSIRASSRWLDENGTPRLWTEATERAVYAVDPHASVRQYFAVQVLFPEHQTCATFFVRVWLAGRAACGEVVLCTLGPPATSDHELWMRLVQLSRGYREDLVEKLTKLLSFGAKSTDDKPVVPLNADRLSVRFDLGNLDPFDQTERSAQHRWSSYTADGLGQHVYWALPNWRAQHSREMCDDYFGSVECAAGLRYLYEQVNRGILEAFETVGFDVSAYRDDKGKLEIHAEQIDRLIVGERVVITKEEAVKNEEAAKKNESQKTPTK
jgi:hypothetical protein